MQDTKQQLTKFQKQLKTAAFNDNTLGLNGAQTARLVEMAAQIAASTFTTTTTPAPSQITPEEVADLLRSANLTDMGNAECLALLHGDKLRYDHTRGRWLIWTGERWAMDEDGTANRLMLDTARNRYKAGLGITDLDQRKRFASFTVTSENMRNLRHALEGAQTLPALATTIDRYDSDPMLANAGATTINLATGETRPNQANDYITHRLGPDYDPTAKCPRWVKFLNEVFARNAELIAFVQRSFGYSLTGDTSEQKLFLCYGTGANGKSVLLSILGRLLGEYAGSTSFDTFDADNERARGDLAKLRGTRVVTVIESDEDKRLNEARVKAVTGCDLVTAEAKFKDPFTYRPTYKLWLAMNHKPMIRGTDGGIWRRIQLIPFEQSFEGRADKKLEQKLEAELPGILNWAIDGLRQWNHEGLNPPAIVLQATLQYRRESDLVGQWLEACTIQGEQMTMKAGEGYKSYKAWCEETGIKPMGQPLWSRRVTERGIRALPRTGKGIFYSGIGLISEARQS
jgi:putative DNA primase/helicase